MFEDLQVGGLERSDLEGSPLAELHRLAAARGVPRFRALGRQELIDAILAAGPVAEPADGDLDRETEKPPSGEEEADPGLTEAGEEGEESPLERRSGVLDLVPDGYGFMRVEGLGRSAGDVYVSRSHVRDLGLRSGDEVTGRVRAPGRSDRYASLAEAETVNGVPVAEHERDRPPFSALTPIRPSEKLSLTSADGGLALRMVELLVLIGRGQRCLIVSPPGAGATTLLKEIARAVTSSREVVPLVVLVDARPEEITEWERELEAPVHAASAERSPEAQVRLAELALEHARRLVEQGKDVALMIDSITRLARAHALVRPRSRRPPREGAPQEESFHEVAVRAGKRWFAAARNTEEGGSLTILATVRVTPGSAVEGLIHEALSESASAEVWLDLELSRAGRWPALDATRMRTQAEESFLASDELDQLRRLRAGVASLSATEAWELLAERIAATRSNSELLAAFERDYG